MTVQQFDDIIQTVILIEAKGNPEMIVSIENNTDKALIVESLNNHIFLEPFTVSTIEITEPSELSIYKNGSDKTFKQRLKEELTIQDIRLRSFEFGLLYSSYLKTVISVNSVDAKRGSIKVKETEYLKKQFLNLRCFSVVDKSNCLSEPQYKYYNSEHKKALKFCSYLSLLLKYGILAIVGVIFDLGTLLLWNEILTAGTSDIVLTIFAAIGFAVFPILFIYNLIWLIKQQRRLTDK